MTGAEILLAIAIFVLRVLNYAIGTIRMVAIARGARVIAAFLAAFEALIFAVVIANIVSDLENIVNLVAYCLGASAGSWLGMELESRLIKGYVIVNVFASKMGHEIAVAMRDAGFGVTEIYGEGREGAVTTLRSVINKREAKQLTQMIDKLNPEAFVAIEETKAINHGWMGIGRGGRRP